MSSSIIQEVNWSFMLDQLVENGFYIQDHFIETSALPTFDQWFYRLSQEDHFKNAKIGNQLHLQENQSIRSDKIYWVEQFPQELQQISSFLNELQGQLNQNLYLGLKRHEMHLSYYPPGSFYQKHIDQSPKTPNRKITIIFYLNPGWNERDGGELVLYHPQNEMEYKIFPQYGKMLLFCSDLFPHEVKETKKERRSLTGWFRND